MFGDKSVLDEQQSSFIGMYDGRLMNPECARYVEVLRPGGDLGTVMTDFNTGAFTARPDPAKTIAVRHHYTSVGQQEFHDVEMGDVLAAGQPGEAARPGDLMRGLARTGDRRGGDAITAEALYPRWAEFLRPDDIVVTETGTSSMGLAFAPMPKGASSTTRPCGARSAGLPRPHSAPPSPLLTAASSSSLERDPTSLPHRRSARWAGAG